MRTRYIVRDEGIFRDVFVKQVIRRDVLECSLCMF